MFLTKKSILKIALVGALYFLLGGVCIIFWSLFKTMGYSEKILLALGIVLYALIVPIIFCGWYAEGKGKLINLGNKLVRTELKPAQFIEHYDSLMNSNELVVKKPSIEVLQLVAVAYDVLDNKEEALRTIEEIIATTNDKKKNYARLLKVSVLFSLGRKDEAEALFNDLQAQKLDILSRGMADAILKSDRAMAMGDYKTAENYNLQLLERTFPKLDNLGKLITHYNLAEIYEKTGDNAAATVHYKYCADFGGETAISTSALRKLREIN